MIAIYVITNTVNAKQYIGITNDLKRRWGRHRQAKDGQLLHKAILKHGVDAFVFTHFANAFDVDAAKSIERMLIADHNTLSPNGYNLTEGGDGTFGYKHTDASKAQSRAANVQTWANPELRAATALKISQAKKGKPNGRKGQPSGRKGIAHTDEHTAHIRLALNTPASKQKRSEAAKKALQDPQWRTAQSARVTAIWAIRKAQKETA